MGEFIGIMEQAMKKKARKYSVDFKQEAVRRMARLQRSSVWQAARRWRKLLYSGETISGRR